MPEEYQVFARKYRPSRFSEVVGQEAIVTTLKGAIKMGRTAHAYLFCGTRGTGKTTLARLLAKALNCASPGDDLEPCNACPSCKEIAAGHAMDVLEIDGASHRGIEDVRQINETIGYAPTLGKYKIYLIDEVHMLTKEAFNALLKTLEEPPPKVKFFFATTEAHKIPATILSRCQRFNLARIPSEKIEAKLAAIATDVGLQAEPEALHLIAELAEGSLRDAESLFDQVAASQKEQLTLDTVGDILGVLPRETLFALDRAGAARDLSAAFTIAAEVFESGKHIGYFLDELLNHYRTLLTVKMGRKARLAHYAEAAKGYQEPQLLEILDLIAQAQQTLKFAPSQRIALEILLLKVLRTFQRLSLDQIVGKLEALEARLQGGPQTEAVPPQPKAPTQPSPQPAPKPAPAKPSPQPIPVQPKPEAAHITENPTPKPSDLPRKKPAAPSTPPTAREETVMRFAAQELGGFLKKET